jgi:hypothetical protein
MLLHATHLELVLCKHFQRLLLANHNAVKGLLLLHCVLHALHQLLFLWLAQGIVTQVAVVIEALFQGGSNGQVCPKFEL